MKKQDKPSKKGPIADELAQMKARREEGKDKEKYGYDNSYISFFYINGEFVHDDRGHSAFTNCDKLKSIVIPDGIEIIGSYSFEMCDNLTSATIPNSVIRIEIAELKHKLMPTE